MSERDEIKAMIYLRDAADKCLLAFYFRHEPASCDYHYEQAVNNFHDAAAALGFSVQYVGPPPTKTNSTTMKVVK